MIARLKQWFTDQPIRRGGLVVVLVVGLVVGGYLAYQAWRVARMAADPRSQGFALWRTGDREARAELVTVQREACEAAPFILPADGFIGLLYGDPRGPYSQLRPHQGIDIFSNTDPGMTPVYAAYDGYLSRDKSWRSAVIIRVPEDPFVPSRQIWLYYTHMANVDGNTFIVDAFPPGSRDVFVEQGTLLGYTGNYNGDSARGVWVHLHFSIVLDDGNGNYTNELHFDNTVDPSRYLGMAVNYGCAPTTPTCTSQPLCADAVHGAGGG